jgi:hypothetical protein
VPDNNSNPKILSVYLQKVEVWLFPSGYQLEHV